MIHCRSLEFHVVHGCNLSCQQCSHYSNFLRGGIVTVEEARENFDAWCKRIQPKRFTILGGEPTLNPNLCRILVMGRWKFRRSHRLLVSNGFFLHRHPGLPKVLINQGYKLEISQHGTSPAYLEKFAAVQETIAKWRRDHPSLRIGIRQSHSGWRRQYNMADGKALPILSNPRDGWKACIQKRCSQLHKTMIWKCPALAYFSQLERKLKLQDIPAWQLFRDYKAIPPTATDAELRHFFATEEILQCGLCPDHKIPFMHADPTMARS
ncbi:radical SAM protein [Novipirellula artificiosorum]|uniref:Radical SAM superfamily protein n=1 Tax=Novipirellula artificiosorum TaxID=2528016 RepID=A0A5C6DTG3_9BACT|nr:radical SAM protein [Novipirellula artificiosorum]TWU39484.1 Radical SAM superfamily protein [Novipirellula artificiosorum]